MAFSDELRAAAKPIWDAQLDHPFVRGLGDGSLDERIFRRWIIQDYLYLKEFARVLAWAAAKTDRSESMAWYAGALRLTLTTEMELHRRYAARFGLSPADLEAAAVWPTTRAYTDFLVRTAAEGDLADLVAALLPCVWGYVHLAQALRARPGTWERPRGAVASAPEEPSQAPRGTSESGRTAPRAGSEAATLREAPHSGSAGGPPGEGSPPGDARYADWIVQYASEEFAAAAEWLRAEIDRLAEGASGAKHRRLTDLFLLSSRYEWQFWEMCWQGEGWPV